MFFKSHFSSKVTHFIFYGILFSVSLPAQGNPEIVLSRKVFSPNSDGFSDSVYISLKNYSAQIRDWTVFIKDVQGRTLRTFRADKRWIRPDPAFSNFFLPGRMDRRPVSVFSNLEWNGKNDENQYLPDGLYSIHAEIQEEKGGIISVPVVFVGIDTVSPVLKLIPENSGIIRPADEKGRPMQNLNEAGIIQKSDSQGIFRAEITDFNGRIIEERNWTGSLPDKALWNGMSFKGDPAEYGSYRYRLFAEDEAGNPSFAEYSGIYIVHEEPYIFLECEKCLLNPDRDAAEFALEFYNKKDRVFMLRNQKNISWNFDVYFEKETVPVYHDSGSGFPEKLKWRPSGRSGQKFRDGVYSAKVTLEMQDKRAESPGAFFYLDSTPPDITLKASQDEFTPDGDFSDDVISFAAEYSDSSPVESWLFQIYITPELKKSPVTLYRTFRGENFIPEKISWAGDGDKIRELMSGEILELRILAKDAAGNTSRLETRKIKSGILVRSDAEGKILKIQLPDQNYFQKPDELSGEGKSALKKVADALDRYAWYYIHAESHVSYPGVEEKNLEITENRAKSMYDFLEKKVFSRINLDYRGFGESELIEIKDEPFIHYRNNRMEFTLERIDKRKKERP